MTLSATAYLEKNKLSTDQAWLVLLKITMPDTTVLRVVANSENVTWPVTAGHEYLAFPFELDEIGDVSKGEVPNVGLKVSNTLRYLEPYLEAQDGLVDSSVTIRIVNATNVTTPSLGAGVNNSSPEVELVYNIIATSADNMWVTFTLGAINPWNKRFPRNRIWRNTCRYKEFGGTLCKYDLEAIGAETSCDRTLDTCRDTMANSINFGGAPGVGSKGIFV